MVIYNPNCDGSGPHTIKEVRKLKTGGDSNALLCRNCFENEMRWRRARNRELEAFAKYDLPEWESLEVYQPS